MAIGIHIELQCICIELISRQWSVAHVASNLVESASLSSYFIIINHCQCERLLNFRKRGWKILIATDTETLINIKCGLKGTVQQNLESFTIMLFQTCMFFFLLWNTKEDILKNIIIVFQWNPMLIGPEYSLKYLNFHILHLCVLQ